MEQAKQNQITNGKPANDLQISDMLLACAIGGTSNSNTITLVNNNMLIGNGVGQQDRVGAAELAIKRATRSKHDINGAAAYSDSFFPFFDGPQTLIDAGVKAILTSSGSIRDQATIDVCVKNNVTLYMIPDQICRGFFGH
jgi:phosphoribosylaminoimidazolecarboxamide formyltransferase / IMP cyclohydrolase